MDCPDLALADMLAGIEIRKRSALSKRAARLDVASFSLADACWVASESARAMYRVTTRGNPTLRSVVRLASVLEVSPEWLLTGFEPEEVNGE